MTKLSKVGKYEVLDLVGEGAMGIVYRAFDPMLNRHVALKVMHDDLARDADFRTRFLREARAGGSLQHPNVITVYDCGEEGGHLYIAMEYVTGTDLEQLMRSQASLSLPRKIDLIIGVLKGLEFAHKRGIVHRDVKPANIRVNEEGRPQIMDFGIAHTTSSNMTKTGLMIGTPSYMAPEQVMGGEITPRTDIFATGVVLYELLTNTRPFEGANLHSVLYKIVSESPPPPERIVTGLRPDLAEIVMKALSKEPADRYASARDMSNVLSTVRAAMRPSGADSLSRTSLFRPSLELAHRDEREEKQKPERRHTWKPVGAAAAGVVLLVVALLLLHDRGVQPREKRAPALASRTDSVRSAPLSAAAPSGMPLAPLKGAPSSTASVSSSSTRPLPRSGTPVAAESFPKKGKRDDASREFTLASPASSDAKGTTRGAAAEAPTEPREAPKAPPVAAGAPPVQLPQSPPTSNPSAEIAAVVARYAKAVESRDVGELRRLIPGMSSTQEGAFEDFFRSVRNLRAALSVSSLRIDGTGADATLVGTYDFLSPDGRSEHEPLTLHAVLHKDGNGWRFVSIK